MGNDQENNNVNGPNKNLTIKDIPAMSPLANHFQSYIPYSHKFSPAENCCQFHHVVKFYPTNVCLITLKIMVTFTTLAKFIFRKVAGLDEICPAKIICYTVGAMPCHVPIRLGSAIRHTCIYSIPLSIYR